MSMLQVALDRRSGDNVTIWAHRDNLAATGQPSPVTPHASPQVFLLLLLLLMRAGAPSCASFLLNGLQFSQ